MCLYIACLICITMGVVFLKVCGGGFDSVWCVAFGFRIAVIEFDFKV